MRILILHNRYKEAGGEDRVVEAEAELLRSNEHDVELYSVTNDIIENMYDRVIAASNASYSYKTKKLILDEIYRYKPDVVHVHNFFPLLTPSVYDACADAGVPVVQTLHNYRIICANGLFMRDGKICEKCLNNSPYHAVIHKCYRNSYLGSFITARMIAYHKKINTWSDKVDRFVALSQFSKTKFVEAGLPAKRIVVKPNFLDLDIILNDKDLSDVGALFIGRLSEEKGIATLLQAWQDVHKKLTIIGDGPMANLIVTENSTGLRWLGFQSRETIFEEMKCALFLVVPSNCYENFPVSIAEAYANGLPVIVAGMGAMAEIVEDGVTGLHFTPGDPSDLKRKIEWAFNHPDEMLKMGENAKAHYEQKYTAEINYKLLMKIYNTVLEG